MTRPAKRETAILGVLTLGAFALCALALRSASGADLSAMTDLGLPTVLPPLYFLALATLTLTFTFSLRRHDPRTVPLIAHLVVLVVVLYGVAPLIEGTSRTAIAWKLRGITEYILRTGRVDADIDAFFNWPGFFILTGLFTRLAGLRDPAGSFPAWAPVFFNLLYLAPVYLLLRAASANPRVPWLGAWFFCLANWIAQDYLAPQAINYFLFLVILVVLTTWFTPGPGARDGPASRWIPRRLARYTRVDAAPVPSTAGQRVGLVAIVVLIYLSIVPSHQLTPMAAIAVVTVLVLCKRVTTRGLPAIMALAVLAWISYGAFSYLAGHFAHVVAPVGAVSENVNANLTNRFRGSHGHEVIVTIRSGFSVVVWLLALAGGIRRGLRGRPDATIALLAIVPFLLLPLQAYGGELLLRVYLFSLPAMVFFAAAAFVSGSQTRMSWGATIGVVLVSVALAGGFLLARYGDERMHYFTSAELAGLSHLYRVAPPDARFVALNKNVPWRYKEYETHQYVSAQTPIELGGTDALIGLMKSRERPTYLIVTRSQLAFEETVNGRDRTTWEQWRHTLLESGVIRPLFTNAGTEIFVGTALVEPHGGTPPAALGPVAPSDGATPAALGPVEPSVGAAAALLGRRP